MLLHFDMLRLPKLRLHVLNDGVALSTMSPDPTITRAICAIKCCKSFIFELLHLT